MVEDEDLDAFAGANENAARDAFDRLSKGSRPYLVRWLAARTRNPAIAEETAQDTLTRVWDARDAYHNQGASKWFAYLKRIAANLLVDRSRAPYTKDVELKDENLPGPVEHPFLSDIRLALMAKRAYWLANLLWLGLDGAFSEEVHDRQLLVAIRYFVDEEPLSEILTSMPAPPVDEPPLTLQLLKEWIRHPGVLRYLIFHMLYYGNERLTLHVLGLDEEDGAGHLLDTLASRCAGASLAELEIAGHAGLTVAIALWRYRSALTPDQISAKYRETLARWRAEEKQISETYALLAAREPFIDKALELQGAFQSRQSVLGANLLQEDGPWRRLVFQYEYHDDVPLPEIARRVQQAAKAAGFRSKEAAGFGLTVDMINSWTNGKQLCRQLAKFWRGTFEGDFDE